MQKSKFFSLFVIFLFSLSAYSNEVDKWTALTLQAIRINKTPPPVAARNLAIVEAGMFDSINSISKKYNPYLLSVDSRPDLPMEVAAAQAARDLLVRIYPSSTPYWDEQLKSTLDISREGTLKSSAIELGSQIAQNIWDLHRNDIKASFTDILNFDAVPGAWIPTPPAYAAPLLPEWGKTKPFGLISGDQFRQDGPPQLYSAEYAKDLNEVKNLGAKNSTLRSAEQTQIALFWADGGGTVTPPGHWNKIALDIIKNKRLDIIETSRLLTLMNLALADAGIACWDTKFTYNFWRPISAILGAASDDNNDTTPDLKWEPLIATPPFPEYTSGHSTFSASAATVLEFYFGSDKMAFVSDSEGTPGVLRSFSRFSEAAAEAGKSRVYGGIHYETSNRDGQKLGRKVGDYIVKNLLLKK